MGTGAPHRPHRGPGSNQRQFRSPTESYKARSTSRGGVAKMPSVRRRPRPSSSARHAGVGEPASGSELRLHGHGPRRRYLGPACAEGAPEERTASVPADYVCRRSARRRRWWCHGDPAAPNGTRPRRSRWHWGVLGLSAQRLHRSDDERARRSDRIPSDQRRGDAGPWSKPCARRSPPKVWASTYSSRRGKLGSGAATTLESCQLLMDALLTGATFHGGDVGEGVESADGGDDRVAGADGATTSALVRLATRTSGHTPHRPAEG